MLRLTITKLLHRYTYSNVLRDPPHCTVLTLRTMSVLDCGCDGALLAGAVDDDDNWGGSAVKLCRSRTISAGHSPLTLFSRMYGTVLAQEVFRELHA